MAQVACSRCVLPTACGPDSQYTPADAPRCQRLQLFHRRGIRAGDETVEHRALAQPHRQGQLLHGGDPCKRSQAALRRASCSARRVNSRT